MESDPIKSQGPNWAETAEGEVVPRYDEAPNAPGFTHDRNYTKRQQLEDLHPEFLPHQESEQPATATAAPTVETPSREHGLNHPYDQPLMASEREQIQQNMTDEERRMGIQGIAEARDILRRQQNGEQQ